MAMHLLGYYTASLASGASYVALGTVPDQMVFSVNNSFQMPKDMILQAAYTGNDAFTDVRVNAPSLRRIFLPSIDPVSNTVLPANRPPLVVYGDQGPRLEFSEGVSVEASRGVVTASAAAALLWISDGMTRTVGGPISTIMATSGVTVSAGAWASGQLTLSSTLPSGRYQVVGMSAYGTNLLASRLVFLTGGLRPGVLAQGAVGEWNGEEFRRGNMGLFGTFDNLTIPSIEHLGSGAGSAQTVYLDLIKIG